MPWRYMGPQGRLAYAQDTRTAHKHFRLYRTTADPEKAKKQQGNEPQLAYTVPVSGPKTVRIEPQAHQEPWPRREWAAWNMNAATPDERRQAQEIEKDWRLNPRYKRKRLGVGGHGITELFTAEKSQVGKPLIPVEEFVMKAPLNGHELGLIEEKKSMKRVAGAAHCVQLIAPELIGREEPPPITFNFMDTYDSSVSGSSSGDGSVDQPPRKKKRTRAWLNSEEGAHELNEKYQRFRQYQAKFEDVEHARNNRIEAITAADAQRIPWPPENPDYPDEVLQLYRKDFLLMYYCTKGSVSSLIETIARRKGDEARVPNRVLWSFWLCMVRACVGMAFPPRKFDPQRRPPRPTRVRKGGRREMEMRALGYILTPDGNEYRVDRGTQSYVPKTEFLEEIPPPSKRWREQRMVHFDIDPANMLVDDQRPAPAPGAPGGNAGSSAQGHGDDDAPLIFKPGFPNGLRPRPTRAEGKLCGISALIESFREQCPGHKQPTTRELMSTVGSEAYANCFPIGVAPVKEFFTVDALAMVLHCWARAYAPDRGYTLVICRPDGSEPHRFPQTDPEEAQQSTLYIYYESGEGLDGHYCSLVPVTDREREAREARDRKAREREEQGAEETGLARTWTGEVLEEHSRIPMLKLADFGLARMVKPEKRNAYYHLIREIGKPGWLAPESFTRDWAYLDGDPDGHELGQGTELAGNFNGSTNIWQVALVMWQMITALQPPEPPTAVRAAGLPASYCPLLLDGRDDDVHDDHGDAAAAAANPYAWVDPHLRRTVYRCLSHDQAHRPRLATLLRDAKERAGMAFDDFTDEAIDAWVRKTWPS